ncbi:MAG: large conductance mechanosensitive channel protein MscL [Firmicutes bacterium]|nr:large conductance mechanosensitive channel protein MscL [Bacillota bacterium]
MWEEFKKFAIKGNVIDLAVAVIIGGAFNKIVTSLVNDLLMPAFGVLLGGLKISTLEYQVGEATIKYGSFLQSIVDFFIISMSIFIFVRLINKFRKKEEPVVEAKATPEPSSEERLLTEIRDLLKESTQGKPAAD